MVSVNRRWVLQGAALAGGTIALPGPEAVAGLFTSAPTAPSSFSFGFGCCLGGVEKVGQWVGLDRVPRDAAFFVCQGDLTYTDQSTQPQTYALYLRQFTRARNHPRMAALRAAMPVHYVQDDHDYGWDDCDRTSFKTYAAQAFHDVFAVPYPDPDWRSWSVGGVDFFLTDNRRYKDPPRGPYENRRWMSVFGQQQRAWLKTSLAASNAALKVAFAPMTAAWYWSNQERQEFVRHCAENVVGQVVLCTGDKHAGADVDLLYAGSPAVVEVLCGPLDNTVKHAARDRNLSDIAVRWRESSVAPDYVSLSNMVGVVQVSPNQATFTWVRSEDGLVLHRRVIPLM